MLVDVAKSFNHAIASWVQHICYNTLLTVLSEYTIASSKWQQIHVSLDCQIHLLHAQFQYGMRFQYTALARH